MSRTYQARNSTDLRHARRGMYHLEHFWTCNTGCRAMPTREQRRFALVYEERFSAFHVPSEGFDLRVSIQPWVGTARISANSQKRRLRLKELSAEMARRFETGQGGANVRSFVLDLLLGVFILVSAASFVTHRYRPA